MTKIGHIPKGLNRVDNPDHPFTFDGPDTLLYNSNGLLAVFIIRQNEYRNTRKLFARVTNTLIAYPAYTKMILLLDSKRCVPNYITQFGEAYFNKFIERNEISKLNNLLSEKKAEHDLKKIKYIQQRIFSFQSTVQKDNVKYIEEKKIFRKNFFNKDLTLQDKAKYYDRIRQREVIARANIFNYQNQYYAQKKLSKNISDLRELKPYFEFVINLEFDVDNGVPYYKHLSEKVLNINDIPKIKFDPFKPIRVASLFGWHLVNSNDFEDLKNRISKYKNAN